MKRILLVTLLVAGAGALLLIAPPAHPQVQLTLEPSMSKGAPGGPVTIVEFSDYQ